MRLVETLHYFTTRGWDFDSKGLIELWETTSEEDRKVSLSCSQTEQEQIILKTFIMFLFAEIVAITDAGIIGHHFIGFQF